MGRAPVILIAFAAMSLTASLSGCQRDTPAEGWFPLAAGHRWTYRVTTRGDDDTSERESLTLRTLGPETVPVLGDSAWRRRSDSGVDYWLRADASGIYRVASKSDLDAEPQPDKAPRFVLKAPYTIGTQWQSTTTAYLLVRRNEFPREIRYTHPNVPMLYTIAAIDEAVETPAGRFAHCLRVQGTASVRVYADPASGWRDLPLTTAEWYCPGVGLVRLERSEPAKSAFLTGGTRTL
ncbi:MAG: hypothetical protein ABI702_26790, partial [Burkholderiales bacterium]